MNTLFSMLRRTSFQPQKLAAIAFTTLPILASSTLASSILPLPAQATSYRSMDFSTTLSTTQPPTTNLYAMSHSLVGTWQATDAAILQMLNTIYSPGGAAPESFTGGISLTFDAAGMLTITYDELQMIFPAATGIPPVTLRGSGVLSWGEHAPGVMSMTGQSHDLEAEVLGMTMPSSLLDVEMDTSTSPFEIVGEQLSFSNFNGPVYLPQTWLRAY